MVALRLPLGGSWILRSKRLRERKEKTFKIFLKNFLRTPASNSHQSLLLPHRLTLLSPPIFLSIVLPIPLFSPNCVFKSTRKENFFHLFQKLFSSQTLIFHRFQNFFPSKCRPRHTFSRRKSTKNGQPAQPKLPKNYHHLVKISISAIPRKKYSKKSKKFQKRG